ncbi:MAG: pilus assembly protein [Actinomycetota bacterium]|nr:pilus assembly protein [Actinomycetota bacterium]
MTVRVRVSSRDGDERGAVAVEFALVLPILVMLLLGTVTAGLSYSHAVGLSNAVREGSRFAATTPYPPLSGDWATDVISRTRAVQFDDPSALTQICVWLYKQGGGTLTSRCDAGTDAVPLPPLTEPATPAGIQVGDCVVKVAASRHYDINAVLVNFSNRVMTRQSVALYETSPCGTS